MAALGCVQACAAANKDILIYGVDGIRISWDMLRDGSATGSAAQQPSVVGAMLLIQLWITFARQDSGKEHCGSS